MRLALWRAHIIPFIASSLMAAALVIGLFYDGGRDPAFGVAFLCLLGAGLAVALHGLFQGFVKDKNPVILAILLLYGYITLSLTWTSVPFASLVTWLVLLSLPLVLMSCFYGLKTERLFYLTGLMLMGGVLFCGLWVLWDVLHGESRIAAGPLPNINNSAALINLGLFAAIGLFFQAPPRSFKQMIAGALMMVLFAALVATASRAACLTFIIGVAVYAFMQRETLSRQMKPFLILCGAFALIAAALMLMIEDDVLHRTTDIFDGPSSNVTARLAIWQATFAYIADAALSGTGLGTYYLYSPEYRLPADVSSGDWAHMDALQLGAETGLAAIFLFYGVAFAYIWQIFRTKSARSPLKTGLSCGLLTVFLHSHVSFPLYVIPVLIATGFVMAFRLRLDRKDQARPEMFYPQRTSRLIYAPVLLVSALLLAALAGRSAYALYQTDLAIKAKGRMQFSAFFEHINSARRWGLPSFIEADAELADAYLTMLENQAVMSIDDPQLVLHEAEQLLRNVGRMNPAHPQGDKLKKRWQSVTNLPNNPKFP